MAVHQEVQDIYSQAQECKSLFADYLESLESPRTYYKQVYVSEQRFLAWASFLGAFADESTSLDRRLQYKPEAKELVLSMLQVLRKNLKHGITHHSASLAPKGPAGTSEPDDALYGITGAIERLERLAMVIRPFPQVDEVDRVRNFASKQKPDGFYDAILATIEFLFPGAEKTLQVQLTESIVYRRHRLLWNRRNSKVFGRQIADTEDRSSTGKQLSLGKGPRVGSTHQQRSLLGFKPESLLISLTQFAQRLFLPHVAKSDFSRIQNDSRQEDTLSSHSPSTLPIVQCPSLPSVQAGEERIMCQYCLTKIKIPLSVSDETRETLWRNHLFEDLRPYVCVSEKCASSPVSFSNVKVWKAHMHDKHHTDWTRFVHRASWRCPHCDNVEFKARDLLRHHLTKHHVKDHAVPLDRLELGKVMLGSKVTRPRDTNDCPLCGPLPWNDPQRRDTLPKTPDTSPDLEKHFVSHLQHLALLSVSWWDNDISSTVDGLNDGADASNVVGFDSDKDDSRKLDDTGDLNDPLDLTDFIMTRISEARRNVEIDDLIKQDEPSYYFDEGAIFEMWEDIIYLQLTVFLRDT
ncbi:hypothetical protein F5Y10DRAFT_268459 [Nemania abortiva]|nr:hypothetical protein F5Y10DRAFT_268459 [Nemania abortiva]